MNRVTSYLACRVQCTTERAIGSLSEATRAKNGHILAPCSDPNGRCGPCWAIVPALFFQILQLGHESHSYSQNGTLRFQVHLVDLLYQRRLVIGEVAAFRRRARRSAFIYGRSTHPPLGAIGVAELRWFGVFCVGFGVALTARPVEVDLHSGADAAGNSRVSTSASM